MRGDQPFDSIKDSLKRASGALHQANIPFLLGGGLAVWARGGPGTGHDLDLLVRPEDADRALQALVDAGMRAEKPPEGWLYKAWDDGVLVDLIFHPTGLAISDEVFERGEDLEVVATQMRVMALEDVFVAKLLALDERSLDYASVLEMARPVREQVDWDEVRRRTAESPYAKTFFTLVEELGIVRPRPAGT